MERSGDLIRAIDLEGMSEAADRLGVSRQRVHQLIKEGTLRPYAFGRRKLLHKRDVDRLIMSRQAKKAG